MGYCNCSTIPLTFTNNRCKGYNNVTNLYGNNGLFMPNITNIILNKVRMPTSLYLSNLSTDTIGCARKDKCPPYATSNLSDQTVLSISTVTVPTRGNSLKSTITALRPGAMAPGGKGVDVKHGSYARYLAQKKSWQKPNPPSSLPYQMAILK